MKIENQNACMFSSRVRGSKNLTKSRIYLDVKEGRTKEEPRWY